MVGVNARVAFNVLGPAFDCDRVLQKVLPEGSVIVIQTNGLLEIKADGAYSQ
jgi:hypothetical protein